MTVEEIRKKLCNEETLFQIVACMKIANHRWHNGKEFVFPSKNEICKNIELLIEEIQQHEDYDVLWKKNYARAGGITINCELTLSGHEWQMEYTPIDTFTTVLGESK